ncbi:hypothetical protein [Sinorhizobium terangae]|uniref:hypothetical protein n=1 Tax=Sinorhizobium terangae TaxID=110322 RepID=UPI0024B0D754|nr:hypothetical protein [Sinorhizobium terangae]WFU52015.1 hypothetical protein QA637_29400 [Sinorhizobium terangae]
MAIKIATSPRPEERSFSTRAPIAGNMNFRKGNVSGSGRKRSSPSRIGCRMTCDRFAHFPFSWGFYQVIAFVFSKSKAGMRAIQRVDARHPNNRFYELPDMLH